MRITAFCRGDVFEGLKPSSRFQYGMDIKHNPTGGSGKNSEANAGAQFFVPCCNDKPDNPILEITGLGYGYHDFSDLGVGFDIGLGCGQIVERKYPVHHRNDAAVNKSR